MNQKKLLGLLPFAWLATTMTANAATLELKLLELNDRQQSKGCPTTVTAYQTAQPYREGSYANDGMIQLSAIATDIEITQTTPFSVTWTGTLKPQYKDCRASAGIAKIDGSPYQGHSFLRMQIINGQASVILDMTGQQDANDYTTVILFKGMRDGNPRWTWGGSD